MKTKSKQTQPPLSGSNTSGSRKRAPSRSGRRKSFGKSPAFSDRAHNAWLAKTMASIVQHYDQQETFAIPPNGWGDVYAVEFFIRDYFADATDDMFLVTDQCVDWLSGMHGVKLKLRSRGGYHLLEVVEPKQSAQKRRNGGGR